MESVEDGLDSRDWNIVRLAPAYLDPEAVGPWVLRIFAGQWGTEFQKWTTPHIDAVAILSLVGVPNLPDKAWEKVPPFYGTAFAMTPYLKHLVTDNRVAGLAVPRPDVDPLAIRQFRGPLDELFDLSYDFLPAP